MKYNLRKLLMHCCCAPCFTYIENDIKLNGILNEEGKKEKVDLTACFYNPNIHPRVEYERRKNAFIKFCKIKECKNVIIDEYNMKDYVRFVVENVGKDKKYKVRCEYCYYMRLKKVFEYAKENGFDVVATTLTISPYQNHTLIEKAGRRLEKEYGVKYLTTDYREHFREGQNMARKLGIYMQKYCGCIFSFEERYNTLEYLKPMLPDEYEISSRQRFEVRKIENKDEYMELFLEADPSEESIKSYLEKSDVYALKIENKVISLAVISLDDNSNLELKNLVTKEEYRNKGYAKSLLKFLCGNFKQKHNKILVGVTEKDIPFFVKLGFDKYEKAISEYCCGKKYKDEKNPSYICKNLMYYSKDLKKKR